MQKSKSFILFDDYKEHLDLITDDHDFRLLIEAIFNYHSDGVLPKSLSPTAKMAFSFIRSSLDRDIKKYNNVCERNKKNIEKRWNTKNTTGKTVIPEIPSDTRNTKNTNNNNDNDNDNDNDNENKTNNMRTSAQNFFDDFYSSYPIKKGKAAAEKAFIKAIKNEKLKTEQELNDFINQLKNAINLQHTEYQLATEANKFIPNWKYPATWLNDRCWLDEVDLKSTIAQKQQTKTTTASENMKSYGSWLKKKAMEENIKTETGEIEYEGN